MLCFVLPDLFIVNFSKFLTSNREESCFTAIVFFVCLVIVNFGKFLTSNREESCFTAIVFS